MAVVKTVKRAGRRVGRVLDAEDRAVLGQAVVLVGGGAVVLVAAAAAIGAAWRVFWMAAGG